MTAKEDAPLDLFKEAEEITGKLWGADGRSWVKRLLTKYGTKTSHPSLRLDGNPVTSADFIALVERRDACRSNLLRWLSSYDVVVCPVDRAPARPPAGDDTEDRKGISYTGVYGLTGWPVVVVGAGTGGNFTALYNYVGWPAGVVRAGTSPDNLPIGIHVVGQPWREDVVLAALQFIDSKTGGWVPPPI